MAAKFSNSESPKDDFCELFLHALGGKRRCLNHRGRIVVEEVASRPHKLAVRFEPSGPFLIDLKLEAGG